MTMALSASLRVALYARVSSEQQTEANTIASQLAELQQRIAADGCTVGDDDCFLDDGISGSTLIRPALERLRDQVANGAIDRLYVHSPDRLARKFAYQALLVDEIGRAGVEIVFLNRALGQSPEDQLLLHVQGVIAEYERTKIAERGRRGKLHAARQGRVNPLAAAPFGYRYVTVTDGGGEARYDVMLEEARVVQQIFHWVGHERLPLHEVRRRLHQQGTPSPKGLPHWKVGTLRYLLRNPAYYGQAGYGKSRVIERPPQLRPQRGRAEVPRRPCSLTRSGVQPIAIAVPALVSEDLFAAAGEQLAENQRRYRQRRRGATFLLQGLLVCARCGYALCGQRRYPAQTAPSERPEGSYRCTGRMTKNVSAPEAALCTSRSISVPLLDQAVWQDVCQLLREPRRLEAEYQRRLRGEPEPSASSSNVAARIAQLKRGIARLIDAYSEGLLEKEEFEPKLRQSKERLARLQAEAKNRADEEAQRAELRLVIGKLKEFVAQFDHGLEEADWATRREIIRTLVKQIEVSNDQIRIVYRVSIVPFVEAPQGGIAQDCWKRLRVLHTRTSAPPVPTLNHPLR
jgi:site-specific DNA recombinase